MMLHRGRLPGSASGEGHTKGTRMKEQSIAIAGGASGLGLVTARLMLERGARRVGLTRSVATSAAQASASPKSRLAAC
jgi:NAD(P)-dependent dehydrogenase (short-subunit alcohol dehydrogenase family)